MTRSEIAREIADLVMRGATFVVNHSGGKDSQAMFYMLKRIVPAEQLVVVHAVLPGVDWDGIIPLIYKQAEDIPVHVTKAGKTFMEMVERRGHWPSPSIRQCTSDLKRDPIEKVIRQLCRATGNGLVVNCTGIRAEESNSRAKQTPFKVNKRLSKAGREVYEWMPIHEWKEAKVWEAIEADGQEPHWAYKAGMSRLSCCFCVMASKKDLCTAAALRPELFAEVVAMERKIDKTFVMPKKGVRKFLDEIVNEERGELALAA